MAFRATMSLKGVSDLSKKLEGIAPIVSRKILAKSLRAAANVVKPQAVAMAPRNTGVLRASIKVRASSRQQRDKAYVFIQTKAGDYKGKAFYGAFQEYGTNVRYHESGKGVGRVGSQSYFRDAFDMKEAEAHRVLRDTLASEIERAMK